MDAKTIFLNNLDEVIIYNANFHLDNHYNYMKKYYYNLKITEYIPILLTKYNHCIIELSNKYQLGTIYLPISMSKFQKEYFRNHKTQLEKYDLFLYGYFKEDSIPMNDLLNIIDLIPNRGKTKKL